jgi:methionyl-tRNA formyltransferase
MGDIIGQERVPIGSEETIATVMDRVTMAYLRLLEENLTSLLANSAPRRPQDHSGASYTCRRLPADNQIDWFAPTRNTFDLIRAVTVPYPGAYTWLNGKKLTIWKAALLAADRNYVGRVPGRVVEVRPGTGAVVLTKDGIILITEVQMEEGQRVCAAEILNSLSMTLGH